MASCVSDSSGKPCFLNSEKKDTISLITNSSVSESGSIKFTHQSLTADSTLKRDNKDRQMPLSQDQG